MIGCQNLNFWRIFHSHDEFLGLGERDEFCEISSFVGKESRFLSSHSLEESDDDLVLVIQLDIWRVERKTLSKSSKSAS